MARNSHRPIACDSRHSPSGNPSRLAFWSSRGRGSDDRFQTAFVFAIAAACFLMTAIGAAHAAGAFAVGACGAYGYGYDFRNVADARVAAMKKCSGNGCKVVANIRRGCAAMAVDAKKPCGSFGWAIGCASGQGGERLAAPLLRIRRQGLRGARLRLRREGLSRKRPPRPQAPRAPQIACRIRSVRAFRPMSQSSAEETRPGGRGAARSGRPVATETRLRFPPRSR